MSLRRDQVLMIRFSRDMLSCWTFLSRWSSQNGPFFSERPIATYPDGARSADQCSCCGGGDRTTRGCSPGGGGGRGRRCVPRRLREDDRTGSWSCREPRDGSPASGTCPPCR